MTMNTPNAVEQWITSQLPVAELTSTEQEELRTLLGDKRLGYLLRLMHGAKQAKLVGLAHLSLDSNPNVARASVIQGEIKGIDLLDHTLLELVPTQDESTEGASA